VCFCFVCVLFVLGLRPFFLYFNSMIRSSPAYSKEKKKNDLQLIPYG
jgi:hypothetical protein